VIIGVIRHHQRPADEQPPTQARGSFEFHFSPSPVIIFRDIEPSLNRFALRCPVKTAYLTHNLGFIYLNGRSIVGLG
jgi:hypothetical protein